MGLTDRSASAELQLDRQKGPVVRLVSGCARIRVV